MGFMVGFLVVLVIIPLAFQFLDRLTDAPAMRRTVNSGTRWWRVRERLRQRVDRHWPAVVADPGPPERDDLAVWRSFPRPRR